MRKKLQHAEIIECHPDDANLFARDLRINILENDEI
jgi:hypothetical protein